MGRQGREDSYRNDRGYVSPLEDQEDEEEDVEEEEGEPGKEDENFSQECQEYYERRERLKELERQRLRRSIDNGKGHTKATNKPLPYDNYGSFFGPSEPIVARRIIADARAREEASKVAARQAKEISEQHRVSKGSSGVSKSVTQPKVGEKSKQFLSSNEAALRLQRVREARDYSFLFTDEDPTDEPPRNAVQATEKGSLDNDRPKQASSSIKGGSAVAQRLPNSVKPGAPTLAKPGAKVTKASISMVSKGQERHSNPVPKLSKPPERPPMLKAKVSSQSGSNSNPSKTTSGPGRPPQARPIVSTQGISNGKQPLSSPSAAQLKSLVASGPKGAGKQSMPSTTAKVTPGKAAPHKPFPTGGLEKKSSQQSGSKSQVSTSRPEQKRPGVVSVGRAASTGLHDQRRPAQSAATSKQGMKPPARMLKRPRESESEDSFLDDDDGGGDVSSMIRKMFGYNPNKYRDLDDEDDRFMETNFHSIQMEEKRSARIAREEDDRELALIEEEERREREAARKKRKQQR